MFSVLYAIAVLYVDRFSCTLLYLFLLRLSAIMVLCFCSDICGSIIELIFFAFPPEGKCSMCEYKG
jgi:hypothetical protein